MLAAGTTTEAFVSGALTKQNRDIGVAEGGGAFTYAYLSLNASNSNNIYSAADTVQMAAAVAQYLIKY